MKTEIDKLTTSLEPASRKAFTLVDLIVLLGVIAVLLLLALPVAAGTRSQTKVAVCASNLRRIAVACQIYANDNSERLPSMTGSVNWPWDLPTAVGDQLLKCGVETNNFYCPGTSPRFTEQENWMNPTPSSLWNFAGGDFHIIGYSLCFAGLSSHISATNQNATMLPEAIRIGATTIPAPPASERVLLADATISANAFRPYDQPANNFTSISGGFAKPHISPHLRGYVPEGGNLAFKDGHVDWRRFQLMAPRTVSGPYFWF